MKRSTNQAVAAGRTPPSFKDAVASSMTQDLTPEEKELLDAAPAVPDEDSPEEGAAEPVLEGSAEETSTSNETPAWVHLPPEFIMPKGRLVGFMRFRPGLTDFPDKGERQCIVWNLTSADEKLALRRCRGDALRTVSEMAKQMIRAIDGVKADWSGNVGLGNVDRFWDEVGSRYRQQLVNYYLKTHSLSTEDQTDFFDNCIAIRTVG